MILTKKDKQPEQKQSKKKSPHDRRVQIHTNTTTTTSPTDTTSSSAAVTTSSKEKKDKKEKRKSENKQHRRASSLDVWFCTKHSRASRELSVPVALSTSSPDLYTHKRTTTPISQEIISSHHKRNPSLSTSSPDLLLHLHKRFSSSSTSTSTSSSTIHMYSSSSEEEDEEEPLEDKMENSITVIINNMNALEQRQVYEGRFLVLGGEGGNKQRERASSFVREDELAVPVMEDEEDRKAVMDVLSSDVKTMQSLLDDKMVLVRALFDVPEWGEYTNVAGWVMTIFQAHTRAIELMLWALKQEVNNSTAIGTLFREDTMPTALASYFLRSIGRTYLQRVIGPHIAKIAQTKHSYEIDLKRPGGAKSNVKRLRKFTSAVVKSIFDSVPICPLGIRDFLYHMCNEIKDRYPQSTVTKTVSSFFFLRFVCPGIVYPSSCGIIPEGPKQATPQAQRCFVLTAKILQNIANGADQDFQEPHLLKLNKVLADFALPMQHFIESMCSRQHNTISPLCESAPTTQQYMNSIKELQKFMIQKLSHIPKCDASSTNAEKDQFQRLIKLRRALQSYSKVLSLDPNPADTTPTSPLNVKPKSLSSIEAKV